MTTAAPPRPKVHLKQDGLATARERAGILTDRALAAAMRMRPSTISRVLNEVDRPGADFIAALAFVFPDEGLDGLFYVTRPAA